MSTSYDQVASVTIDISTTIVDTGNFDSILIVGALPSVSPDTPPAKCGCYDNLNKVIDAGWVVSGDDADPVGVAAKIAFAQNPAPSEIYIAPIQTTDDGTEYATETVERAMATNGWYVVCPVGITGAELESLADYVENQEKMMIYTEKSFFAAGDDGEDVATISGEYYRTVGVYARESSDQTDSEFPNANNYLNVAYAVAWLANEAGSETAAFKTLYDVYPSTLTTVERRSLENNNVCYFTTIGSKNVSMLGKVLAGEWCDIIRFRDWLKNEMQENISALFMSLPKIPYTDGGISLIKNAIVTTLQKGQDSGGIAETEYDDDGNENPGYQVTVPSASEISDTDKSNRTLSGCKFTARLSGAIHFAEITGSLAYSLT